MNRESLELRVKETRPKFKKNFSRVRGILRTGLALSPIIAYALSSPASSGEASDEIAREKGVKPSGLEAVFPDNYRCPVIISKFGVKRKVLFSDDGKRRETREKELHFGTDLAGTYVIAPAGGEIIDVRYTGGVSGNIVAILHKDTNINWPNHYVVTIYRHLKDGTIKATINGIEYVGKDLIGKEIERGKQFAEVGNSGSGKQRIGVQRHTAKVLYRKFAPHLHIEAHLYEGDKPPNGLGRKGNYFIEPVPGGKWVGLLYLMGLNQTTKLPEERLPHEMEVKIQPYFHGQDYSNFVGFTWPIVCKKKLAFDLSGLKKHLAFYPELDIDALERTTSYLINNANRKGLL